MSFNYWRSRRNARLETGNKARQQKPLVTDDQILSAIGAWMLSCAVGAYNKTLSTAGTLDFDTWFTVCRTTWVKRVSDQLSVSPERIESVTREYARKNQHRTYQEVFDSEQNIHPEKE